MYWAYKHWDDPTTADAAQGMFADDADLDRQVRQAASAGPHLPAGDGRHPPDLTYDPTTGAFTMTYEPRGSTHPTEIFVSPITAPNGYDVSEPADGTKNGSSSWSGRRPRAPSWSGSHRADRTGTPAPVAVCMVTCR